MLPTLSSRTKEILLILLLFLISFSINLYNWDSLSLFEGRGDIHMAKLFSFENPEMAGGYTGTIFFLLFMRAILGLNLFSIRLASAISIASIAVFTYLFAKDYFDRRTAMLTAAMLVMSPVFILTCISDAPFLGFFPALLSLLFYRYCKTKDMRYLYVGAFVSGYSLYHKLTNLYFLVGLTLSFMVVKYIFKLKTTNFNLNKRLILILIFLFTAGFSPLIIYNTSRGFPLISAINHTISEYGTALSTIDKMDMKIRQFAGFSREGSPISEDVMFLDPHNPIMLLPRFRYFNLSVFLISATLLIISRDPKKMFLILLVFFYSCLTIFTPTELQAIHYMPVQPFFFLIMASGLIMIYKLDIKTFKIKNINKILFAILFGIFIFLNLSYLIMCLSLTKDQIFVEEALPTKAIVHHRVVESLEDADVIVVPKDTNLVGDYISHIYPEKEVISSCNVSYDEASDTCSFVSCKAYNLFFTGDKKVRYVFPYLPENPVHYNLTGYGIIEGYGMTCNFDFRPYSKYNNTNYPLEFFLSEAIKRNKTPKLEKDFVNAHGEIVYRIYSIESQNL